MWSVFAKEQRPEYEVTVTFPRPYGDGESIDALRFLTKAVQKRIPSPRFLRGIACAERTWKNAKFEGCLHSHSLLWGINNVVAKPLDFITEVVHKEASRLKDRRGRSMYLPENIEIQPVYDADGIINYVTKDIDHCHPDRRTQVWLIDKNGLRFELLDKEAV
jgi:hypothetical protein